uniref:HNH endonuclease n=1 Tax=Arthrobacter alpinus TaxID=656366 RepID=UPI001647BA76
TEAHHIIPWYQGGESNINNAAPLCGPHHTLTHQGHWTVRLHHGIPFYTPSYNVDPTQHERRNTYHHGTPPAHKTPPTKTTRTRQAQSPRDMLDHQRHTPSPTAAEPVFT